jgi:hypothetical protein
MNRRDGGVLFLRFVLIPILFGAAGVLPAAADAIIYNVNRTVVLGSVTGTITTDGTIGTLATNDITSWNLTLNGPAASPFNLTNLNSGVEIIGNDLSADATNLYFDFSGPSGLQWRLNISQAEPSLESAVGDACVMRWPSPSSPAARALASSSGTPNASTASASRRN